MSCRRYKGYIDTAQRIFIVYSTPYLLPKQPITLNIAKTKIPISNPELAQNLTLEHLKNTGEIS